MAGDEAVHLGECQRVIGSLAMVDLGNYDIFGALEFRAVESHAGIAPRFAENAAVGLRVLVVVVAADGHEAHAFHDFVRAGIELGEEGPLAVELVAARLLPVGYAVVRRAAEDGVRHISRAAAVLQVVPDRIAAARAADEHDLVPAGELPDLFDLGGEFLHLLGRGRAQRLRLGIRVARQRIRKVDRIEEPAVVAIRLEPPERRDPQCRGIAIAVHENDRRLRLAARRQLGAGTGREKEEDERAAGQFHGEIHLGCEAVRYSRFAPIAHVALRGVRKDSHLRPIRKGGIQW